MESLLRLASSTNQCVFKGGSGFNNFIRSSIAAEDFSHQNFNYGHSSMRFAVGMEADIGGYSQETWKLRLQ